MSNKIFGALFGRRLATTLVLTHILAVISGVLIGRFVWNRSPVVYDLKQKHEYKSAWGITAMSEDIVPFDPKLETRDTDPIEERPWIHLADPSQEHWDKLKFQFNYDRSIPKLKEIRLIIPNPGDWIPPEGQTSISITSRSPRVLEEVEMSMWDSLRMVTPGNVLTGAGATARGYLEIEKEDGSVLMCGLTPGGFALEATEPTSRNRFWSQALTEVVDRLYMRHTGEHLPSTLLDSLAGPSPWLHPPERRDTP